VRSDKPFPVAGNGFLRETRLVAAPLDATGRVLRLPVLRDSMRSHDDLTTVSASLALIAAREAFATALGGVAS